MCCGFVDLTVMRSMTVVAFGIWVGLAFLIFDIKHETRRLEAQAATLARAIQQERENLAVSRAEWSHLTRPDHIERLARHLLGLQPIRPDQIVHWKGTRPAGESAPPEAGANADRDAIAALIHRSLRNGSEPGAGDARP